MGFGGMAGGGYPVSVIQPVQPYSALPSLYPHSFLGAQDTWATSLVKCRLGERPAQKLSRSDPQMG